MINNLLLDNKNKKVLIKKIYNEEMTKQEKKRLYRTTQIIHKANKEVEENKKYEDEVDRLFF